MSQHTVFQAIGLSIHAMGPGFQSLGQGLKANGLATSIRGQAPGPLRRASRSLNHASRSLKKAPTPIFQAPKMLTTKYLFSMTECYFSGPLPFSKPFTLASEKEQGKGSADHVLISMTQSILTSLSYFHPFPKYHFLSIYAVVRSRTCYFPHRAVGSRDYRQS